MRVYFNHVGQEGAANHFPMTVFRRRSIDAVRNTTFPNAEIKNRLIAELEVKFPDGTFNAWGAPIGAISVISEMVEGDVVLLVDNITAQNGVIPAMGVVKTFIPAQLPELSYTLWGADKFAYVFFFDTIELELGWIQFLEYIGYKTNLDPHGTYMRPISSRFTKFGGERGFFNYLMQNHAIRDNTDVVNEPTPSYRNIELEADLDYQAEVESAKPNKKTVDDVPRPRAEKEVASIGSKWNRDPTVGKNALAIADYKCETDATHQTFISATTNMNYVEAHHLIPIKFQDQFDNSIDVESNVMSLCPNCHREVHLAKFVEKKNINQTIL